MVISSDMNASLTKIGFLDLAQAIRLILAKLLHGFLAKITTRVAAHPARTRGRRIDHLAKPSWIAGKTILVPILTPVPLKPIPMMPAYRPGQFAVSI
jgi:hypothetical protein